MPGKEKRPHISPEVGEIVEKFAQRHMGTAQYEVYEKLIRHFIGEDGTWKSRAPDDLKDKFGQELAF